jgi:uncharacterized protein YdbL (DUF1318 family)
MRARIIGAAVFLLMLGVFASASGSSAGDIKARMKGRLPVVKALKAKGVVGENNKGYLEFRGGNREKVDVVNAENADRKKVYTAIAKQQGTTADTVGKRRALQIAKKAKTGEWIQGESGKWNQKK